MRSFIWVAGALGATSLAFGLGACGSSSPSALSNADPDAGDGTAPVMSFKVGGSVMGLAGTGLVLQNNAGDSLSISADGAFEFALPVASGANFNVTVKEQPTAPSQTCTLSNATGTVGTTDVKDVTVACATNSFVVGGTVSGLEANGLVVENNGGDALTLNAAGPFSFAIALKSGATYDVKLKAQPTGVVNECSVTAGTGTVANGPVTSVAITCVARKRVFVTSERYHADLGGLAGADAKCQALADAASLGGTYKAWLSDATGSPSTRFTKSTTPYVRLDGMIVANDWADLTDGTLLASISITELDTAGPSGNACGASAAWTNTSAGGTQTSSTSSCGNWSGAEDDAVSMGDGNSTSDSFTGGCNMNGGQVCPSTLDIFAASLYCFEQ
jgi:hypothetical protein